MTEGEEEGREEEGGDEEMMPEGSFTPHRHIRE